MNPTPRQSTFVAISLIILVGVITVVALDNYDVDAFLKVWAVIGTLVGVVTGAVPSFFFSVTASKAQEERAKAEEKVQTVLGVSPPGIVTSAAELRPDLFGAGDNPLPPAS